MVPKVPLATIKNDFKHESKFLETFEENQAFYAWQFQLKLRKRQAILHGSIAEWRVLPMHPHSN